MVLNIFKNGLPCAERLAHLDPPTLLERKEELCHRYYKSILRPADKIHDILPPIKLIATSTLLHVLDLFHCPNAALSGIISKKFRTLRY